MVRVTIFIGIGDMPETPDGVHRQPQIGACQLGYGQTRKDHGRGGIEPAGGLRRNDKGDL